MESRRFTPYRTHHTRPTTYENAEAGPSTQLAAPIPYNIQSITQPTGGISETAADAEQVQPITEEYETPVSDFYCSLVLRVTNRLIGVRNLGSSVLMAKGRHASTVSATTRTYSSSGNGGRLPEGTGNFRATWKRSPVNTYPISRYT